MLSSDENQTKKIRDKAARYLKTVIKTNQFRGEPAEPDAAPINDRGITPERMQRINRQDELRRLENGGR